MGPFRQAREDTGGAIISSIEILSEFYGTYPDAYHGALLRLWDEYADLWNTRPDRLKALPVR